MIGALLVHTAARTLASASPSGATARAAPVVAGVALGAAVVLGLAWAIAAARSRPAVEAPRSPWPELALVAASALSGQDLQQALAPDAGASGVEGGWRTLVALLPVALIALGVVGRRHGRDTQRR